MIHRGKKYIIKMEINMMDYILKMILQEKIYLTIEEINWMENMQILLLICHLMKYMTKMEIKFLVCLEKLTKKYLMKNLMTKMVKN